MIAARSSNNLVLVNKRRETLELRKKAREKLREVTEYRKTPEDVADFFPKKKKVTKSKIKNMKYSDAYQKSKEAQKREHEKTLQLLQSICILQNLIPTYDENILLSKPSQKNKCMKDCIESQVVAVSRRSSILSEQSRISVRNKRRTIATLVSGVMKRKKLTKRTSHGKRNSIKLGNNDGKRNIRKHSRSTFKSKDEIIPLAKRSAKIIHDNKLKYKDVLINLNLQNTVWTTVSLHSLFKEETNRINPFREEFLQSCIKDLVINSEVISPTRKIYLLKCCERYKYSVYFKIKEKNYLFDSERSKQYLKYCIQREIVPTLYVNFGDSI